MEVTGADAKVAAGRVTMVMVETREAEAKVAGCSAFATGDGHAEGGGVLSQLGNASLVSSTVSGCSASATGDGLAVGGGLFSEQGDVSLVGSTVSGCSAFATVDGFATGGGVSSSQDSASLVGHEQGTLRAARGSGALRRPRRCGLGFGASLRRHWSSGRDGAYQHRA